MKISIYIALLLLLYHTVGRLELIVKYNMQFQWNQRDPKAFERVKCLFNDYQHNHFQHTKYQLFLFFLIYVYMLCFLLIFSMVGGHFENNGLFFLYYFFKQCFTFLSSVLKGILYRPNNILPCFVAKQNVTYYKCQQQLC